MCKVTVTICQQTPSITKSMSDDNPHQPLEFSPPSVEHLAKLLPAYSFEQLIAKGGMGAVYKATQTSLDRPVAVKVLPPELGESETFRESFITEAKLMARLNHPNLISVFDFGEVENMLYIVMEFVDGATLYEKTYGGHLDQQEALEVTIAICRALANAHDAGILHRDIKPANIFITKSGIPKIGDFGLARPSGDTETGVIFGTPGYTAPEVLSAPDKVGPATDIFAVGVMLYELLAGKIPGKLYEPIIKYSKCDPMIDRLIRKAMSASLEQRYSSAEEFADELEDIYRSAKKRQSKPSTSPLLDTQAIKQSPTLVTIPAGKTARTPSLGNPLPPQRGATELAEGVKVGGGGMSIRNFIIIITLLGAIYGVLQWKDAKEAKITEIEKQNEEIVTKPVTPPQITPKETPPVEKILERKTLEQLQNRLAAGERPIDEMPKETISLDNDQRLVLFIDKQLTWHQAQLWAANYGAQLATVASDSDLAALSKSIPAGENAWIGAATAGYEQWAWADGTLWNNNIAIRKTSKLAFAQLDSDMFASAKKSKDKSKFLIEWKTDGSQPAELKQQMARVIQTLNSLSPTYPAGSITFSNRNYYLCPFPLKLSQAQRLAKSAGAHIAIPSDEIEMFYFGEFIPANVPSGKLCRIGGVLQQNEWKWLTGEEWQIHNWDENYPKNQSSLVATSSSKWRDASHNKRIPYTLFEWSEDAPANGAITLNEEGDSDDSEFSQLQAKAAQLVKGAEAKRREDFRKNIKRLKWDLDFHFRGLSRTGQAHEQFSVNKINELIADTDRIKKSISGMGKSDTVKKLTTAAYEKQERIEASYEENIDKIRVAYERKLRTLVQDLESKGQATAIKTIQAALQTSAQGSNAFIELFE